MTNSHAHQDSDLSTLALENRLRLKAKRRGLRIQKSRRRDRVAYDYGVWWISVRGNLVSPEHGLALDEVEEWLDDPAVLKTRSPESVKALLERLQRERLDEAELAEQGSR